MAGIPYVGRNPDTDVALTPRSYSDTTYAASAVSSAFVTSVLATETSGLATGAYVDNGDANRAKKTDVTAADATYLAATVLGATNGVASLDSSGNVVSGQLPSTLRTDRTSTAYSCYDSGIGTVFLSGQHTVNTTTLREYRIASINVPDPGYPWTPLIFGAVLGGATSATAPATRDLGTGNYGLVTVMGDAGDNRVHASGIGTGSIKADWTNIWPYAKGNDQPYALNSGQVFNLYSCMWSGTTYTYQSAGLVFYVIVLPSMS